MKEINISGFGGSKEPKKWWVGVDEEPGATCEAGWTDLWYAQKVHTKIGDAFVTFQCDNDNHIQFLNLEEHDKKLKEECKATTLELCNMSCWDRVGIFGQGYSISDILRKWTIDEIREKIDKFKELKVGDEVECIGLGAKWRGIVCKINDEDIHLYRYRDSLIRSDDYRPVVEIYRKDGSTYKSLKKTGQHYSDFELLDLINKGEA